MALLISANDHQQGEALVVGFTSDEDLSGSTVVGRISVNSGAAVEVSGVFDDAVGGKLLSGYVAFPGETFPAAKQRYAGTLVITKPGQPWSPLKENFNGQVGVAV